jgi:hypothetical protein
MLTAIENIAVPIKKADIVRKQVFGEVYAPNAPDSHGDFMTEDSIREMAYKFMKDGRMGNVDTMHDNELNGSYVIESFIARKGDPDFIADSWVVGVQCSDDSWEKVENGEINGFSMEALVQKTPTLIEMEIPDWVTGGTSITQGHSHTFKVAFDIAGSFNGGVTDTVDGHFHNIRKGTITEDANDHNHRFSFVELLT